MRLLLHKVADKSSPREYCTDCGGMGRLSPEELCPACQGTRFKPWPLSHVELDGGPPPKHEFSTSFVARAKAEGWVSQQGDLLTFNTKPEAFVYRIVHRPTKDEPLYRVELEEQS